MAKKKTTSRTAKSKHYNARSFQKALGEHCSKLRKRKGLSVNLLADLAGMSPSIVIRLEKGTSPVNVATLLRYSRVLDLPVRALFEFDWTDDEK